MPLREIEPWPCQKCKQQVHIEPNHHAMVCAQYQKLNNLVDMNRQPVVKIPEKP